MSRRTALLRVVRACALAAAFAVAFLLAGSLPAPRLGPAAVPLALLAAAVAAWRWDGGGWRGPAPAEGPRAWARLATGIGWGAATATVILAGLLATGTIGAGDSHDAGGAGPRLLRMAAYYALVAVAEESFFRAYLLRTLACGLGSRAARLAVAAGLFAAIHAINPAYGVFALCYAGALGVVLGAAFELTGSLSLCIGFHWAFNAVQDAVWVVPPTGGEAAHLAALAVAAVPLIVLPARRRRRFRSALPPA